MNTVAATKKVEVTFWHAMTRANLDTLTALANEFMADHPNIQINLAYQGGYGDLSTKLLAAIMAGNPPVMAQMYEDWTMKFLEADALMPLGDQLSPATIVDIPQSLIESNTYLVNGKKALMTVPFNKSAMVLFYNTDLMKQPPKTWDELLQVSKDLTVVKGDTTVQYGFGIRPYTEFFIQFFHQAGGKIFNEDMTKCLINSEAGIQAMNYLLQLKPYSLYQSAYLSDPFGAGKVAMYIGSSAGITFVASASKGKHGWMTADLPAGSINGESMIQGTNIGVFKIGTTQVQRAAAVEFVRFLLSQKATIEWAEGTGYLPVLKSAAASDAWQKYVATHPDRKATTNMILKGFVYPHQANMYNIRSEIETAFEQVMLGKATPKAALDAAAQKIDSEYLSH
ncbi:MAG TPA: ABC transporter substrate-binding protein [Candidatus Acetothermia bacterium]|nr:ABC transporter substrate-binding protein [Candidatus Acetothermia bacterium]